MTESSKVLNPNTVVMESNGCITILEAQQEFEGDLGAVIPAKSIWLNSSAGRRLQAFLNAVYPLDGGDRG